eukprot:GHVH01005853.1.p1 GENE.GHVH01005853.1~~GHVH01005853.1.p1  ORF type:complete len:1283 (+),score=177.65 GHVH01005853.1:56-3850(+)
MSSPPVLRQRRNESNDDEGANRRKSETSHKNKDRKTLAINKDQKNQKRKRLQHTGALRLPDVFAKSKVLAGDQSALIPRSAFGRLIDRLWYILMLTRWTIINLWPQIIGVVICTLVLFHASVIFSRGHETPFKNNESSLTALEKLATGAIDWYKISTPIYPESWTSSLPFVWPSQPNWDEDDRLLVDRMSSRPIDYPTVRGSFTTWESSTVPESSELAGTRSLKSLFTNPDGCPELISGDELEQVAQSDDYVLGVKKKERSLLELAKSSLSFSNRSPYIDPLDMGFPGIERNGTTFAGTIYDAKLWGHTDEARALPTGAWWSPWVLYPGTGDANAIMQHPYQLIVIAKKKGVTNLVGDKAGLEILAPLPVLAFAGSQQIGYEQASPEKIGLFVGVRLLDEFDYVHRHFVYDWDSMMVEKRWSIRQVDRFSDYRVNSSVGALERQMSARIVRGHPWITMHIPVGQEMIIATVARQMNLGQNTKIEEISSLSTPPGLQPPQSCNNITGNSKWTDDAIAITLDDGTQWAVLFSSPTTFECEQSADHDRIVTEKLTAPITVRVGIMELCNHIWWSHSQVSTGYFPEVDSHMHLCPDDSTRQRAMLRWNLFSSLKKFGQERLPEISMNIGTELDPGLWEDIIEGITVTEQTNKSLQTFLPYFRKNPLKDELINMMESIYNGAGSLLLGGSDFVLPVNEVSWSYWDVMNELKSDIFPDTLIIPSNFVTNDNDFYTSVNDGLINELRNYVYNQGGNIVFVGGGNGGYNSKFLETVFNLRLFENPGKTVFDNNTMSKITKAEFVDWGIEHVPPYNGQMNVPPELLPDALPKTIEPPVMSRHTKVGDSIQTMAILYPKWPFAQYCSPDPDNRDPEDIGFCDGSTVVSWYHGLGFIHWIGRQWDENADEAKTDWVKILARTIWAGVCSEHRRVEENVCADLSRVVYFTDQSVKEKEEAWAMLYNDGVFDFEGNFDKERLKMFLMSIESLTTWNIDRAIEYVPSSSITWKDMMLKHALGVPIGTNIELELDEVDGEEHWSDSLLYDGAHSARLRYQLQCLPFPGAHEHSLSPFYYSKSNYTPLWAPERVLLMMTPLHRKLEYKDRSFVQPEDLKHTPLGKLRSDMVYSEDEHNCLPSVLGNICTRSFGPGHPCLTQYHTFDDFEKNCREFRLHDWDAWVPERRLFKRKISQSRHPTLTEFSHRNPQLYAKLMPSGNGVPSTIFSKDLNAISDSKWRLVLSVSPLRPGSPLHRLLTQLGYLVCVRSMTSQSIARSD